jgi:hypothetical protein
MKIDRARTSTWSAISLLVPALAACADDPSTTTTTDSGSSSSGSTSSSASEVPTTGDGPTTTGLDPTTSTSTSTSTTGDSTTGGVSATSTGTSSGTTTGEEPCMTILCGDPAACCLAGEECVDGECVDSCPGGVRCGEDQELCCADGELCAGAACAAPGGPCKDAADCEPGDFCEPQLGKCLEQLGPLLCAQPKSAEVEVTLEWSFTKDEVIAMPVVADVTGDGTPEVIVNTARVTGVEGDFSPGEIVCLDGETGAELWRIKHDPVNKKFGAQGRATIAVGDVSGDGEPDIVYAGLQEGPTKVSPIHAVDGDGVLLWTSHLADDTVAKIRVEQGTATLVNLDADPQAEIAFGAAILDHDGLLVWNQSNIGGMVGTPHATRGSPRTISTRAAWRPSPTSTRTATPSSSPVARRGRSAGCRQPAGGHPRADVEGRHRLRRRRLAGGRRPRQQRHARGGAHRLAGASRSSTARPASCGAASTRPGPSARATTPCAPSRC